MGTTEQRKGTAGAVREYRIIGPPGTGKTHKVAGWARQAVERYGGSRVLIASMTKAAAEEIALRDTGVDPFNVGTLHSICYRLIESPTLVETNADLIEDWNKRHPRWWMPVASSNVVDDIHDHSGGKEAGALAMAEAGVLRACLTPIERWPQLIREFYDDWTAWKREIEGVDFTDMIEHVLEAELVPEVDVGFIDEAQDLSTLEFALARMWAREWEFVVFAGDTSQCLYSFRGATPRNFIDRPVPDDHVIPLTQSFRVPSAPHAVAMRIVRQEAERIPVEYQPAENEGEVIKGVDPYDIGDLVEKDLEREVPEGKQKVMILATCDYMLAPLIYQLRERGIPFHNPYKRKKGPWNPIRENNALRSYLVAFDSYLGEKRRPWTWVELKRWATLVNAKNTFVRGAKAVIDRNASQRAMFATATEELESLFEPDVWYRLSRIMAWGDAEATVKWIESRVNARGRKSISFPATIFLRRGRLALIREPEVVVGTVHSVKGGEAASVYVLPDLSRAAMDSYQWGGVDADPVVRQFYVAVTRTFDRLTLLEPMRARPGFFEFP